MTAKELHDAIAGLPEEATCQTIRFNPFDDTWFAILWPWSTVRDDHAEALHRDAMTEWLARYEDPKQCWWPEVHHEHRDDVWAFFLHDRYDGYSLKSQHPSRTIALIAAVRYVSVEVKA